jgi:putative transposase
MAKHPKPEEIVAKLRQADVLILQGQSVADAIRPRREFSDGRSVAA